MSLPVPTDSAPPPFSGGEPLLCPLCDYDLRGQVEPRCPECGYRFEWAELTDPARRRHRFLFEHHPERNVWSLWRTFFASLRPWRFWGELLAAQRTKIGRLLLYWFIILALCAAPYLLVWGEAAMQIDASNRSMRSRWVAGMPPKERAILVRQHGSLQAYLDQVAPIFPSPRIAWAAVRYRPEPLLLIGMLTVVWPWLTFAALMVFQISMRRAKVRAVHVLRCVIYSADVAIAAALATAAIAALRWMRTSVPYFDQLPALYVAVGLLVLLTYRLWIAYRKYLRFDHPLATVIASQIMVMLLVFKFALDWRLMR